MAPDQESPHTSGHRAARLAGRKRPFGGHRPALPGLLLSLWLSPGLPGRSMGFICRPSIGHRRSVGLGFNLLLYLPVQRPKASDAARVCAQVSASCATPEGISAGTQRPHDSLSRVVQRPKVNGGTIDKCSTPEGIRRLARLTQCRCSTPEGIGAGGGTWQSIVLNARRHSDAEDAKNHHLTRPVIAQAGASWRRATRG